MSSGDYAILTDIDKLAKLSTKLLEKDLEVAFDLETGYSSAEPDRAGGAVDWDWDKQFVVGFSFSGDPSWARYVPLRHDTGGNVEDEAAAWEAIRPLLEQGKITAHNSKFEERGVRKAGGFVIASKGDDAYLEDTMLMAYALGGVFKPENGIRAVYGLKELVLILLQHRMKHIDELFPTKLTENQKKAMRFNVLGLTSEVVTYACEDAAWTLALRKKIRERAYAERKTMFDIEHEVSRILAEMEEAGVGVDWEAMRQARDFGDRFMPLMEKSIKDGLGKIAGRDLSGINLGSSQQLQALLYRDIGLTTSRMTKGAEKKLAEDPNTPRWKLLSTDENAMKALSKKHPPIKKLLEFREAQNMLTRLDKLWINAVEPYTRDGRAHPGYRQAGTEDNTKTAPGTGRFSASDPPIQQCPKEFRWALAPIDVQDEAAWNEVVQSGRNGIEYWNGHFREYIVAAPGYYLLTFDFSQIELRVLAGVSQEPALLAAFERGVDVHRATAAQMLGKRVEDVTDKERQDFGKRLNFALLYQEGPGALAEQLSVSVERAKELMAQYFSAFSKVGSWQEAAVGRGLRTGYAETFFGRRYEVHELKSKNQGVKAKGKRVLVNAPIQGAAADYMKIAMISVVRELKRRGWWRDKVMLIMNQHDALTFECSNDVDPNEVKDVIEQRVTFPVRNFPKIVADWEMGQTWGGSTAWKKDMVARWDGERWTLDKPERIPQAEEKAVDAHLDTQDGGVSVDEPQEKNPEPPGVDHQPRGMQTTGQFGVPVTVSRTSSVIIHASRTPDRESFSRLLRLISSLPGETEVLLKCPAGEVPLGRSSLSMADSGRVSLLLSGAMMTASASSEELQEMASALTL